MLLDTSFISLHNEDLGNWSELGVLSVLSLLQQQFYRARLVLLLANAAMPAVGVAIANQTPGQVEQGQSACLSGENQVSGVGVKIVHEGKSFAVPVPSAEKWSHEVIVAFVKSATGTYAKTQSCGEFGAESGV